MSEFYKYISKIIINYFSSINLQTGQRFSLQFEQNERVTNMYNSIRNTAKGMGYEIVEFQYKEDYCTYCIEINNIRLLVAQKSEDVREDFLTFLRNQIGTKEEPFRNTALLILHDTNLDSIIGGSKRLESEGMPLHLRSIERNLNESIETSKLNEYDKRIIKLYLERTRDDVYESSSSIFDYKSIYSVLEMGFIEENKFKEFGMFRDSSLGFFSNNKDKALDARINDNMSIYNTIDQIHKYSDLNELEQYFEHAGVNLLEKDDWYDNEYDKVSQLKEKHDKQINPIYCENDLIRDNPSIEIWDRPDGLTKAKQRKRHIIVFNENAEDKIVVSLRFNAKVEQNFVINDNKKVEANTNNQLLKITFSKFLNGIASTKIMYYNITFHIIVVNVSSSIFGSIKGKYQVNVSKKKPVRIDIIDDKDHLILNQGYDETQVLYLNEQISEAEICPEQELKIYKNNNAHESIELYELYLTINGTIIPFGFKNEMVQINRITAYEVWVKKKISSQSFQYEKSIEANERVKLIHGTRVYYPTSEFRKLLDYEEQYINSDAIAFNIHNNEFQAIECRLPEDLESAYLDVKNYFKHSNTLPSLTSYSEELTRKANKFIQCYFKYLDELSSNDNPLKNVYKEINKLGIVKEINGENKIYFTPLHPVNLMYQIMAKELTNNNDFNNNVEPFIGHMNLIPYIFDKSEVLFKAIDNGTIEWTTFVENENSKYNSSNKYTPRIVSSKIKEFTTHFGYLFISELAPLKIGIVNLGDCKEIVQGIFEYYINELKNHLIEELRPIEVYIYDDTGTYNIFEELSCYDDAAKIKENFGFNLNTKKYNEDDVLSMYRTKVHFFKLHLEKLEYNHLIFYKMNDQVTTGTNNMEKIDTGISLNGMISNVPSVFIENEYVTGFGSKNLKYENDDFLKRLTRYNSFVEYINKLVPYNNKTVLATAISAQENCMLKQIYKKSHWVTFIDPKVDLNYFLAGDNAGELMIIHYSDQYTSSSGYDAITVTQKSKIYTKVIQEFLTKETDYAEECDLKEIVNSFNVFNGEWLLRLISRELMGSRDQFSREKLSLFSAVKLYLAYNVKADELWIPISFEEIIRVSGATGLSQSDSIFNPKKFKQIGSFSDDILMIGIKKTNDDIQVMYYPIEVKIGNNGNTVLKKAEEQVRKTTILLRDELVRSNSFYGKLLRNQLITLALTQMHKISLYNIWNEKHWEDTLNGEDINKLLSDEYTLVDRLDGLNKDCGIITFTKHTYKREEPRIINRDVTIEHFECPLNDAYKYLSIGLKDIYKLYFGCEFNGENLSSHIEEYRPFIPIQVDATINPEIKFQDEIDRNEIPNHVAIPIGNNLGMEIVFGEDPLDNKDIIWEPNYTNKVMHTNTGIIGTMGTGKTQFTKSLITQIKQQDPFNVNNQEIGILIFDYKGDYVKEDFTEATKAKVYNLYNLPFNPLSIYKGKTFKPMLPLHVASELRDTIANAYSLGNVQKNTLSVVLEKAYESMGIIAYDESTWSKPAPTIDKLYRIYNAEEYPTSDSLYAALNELNKYRIFEADANKTKPLFDLINGVTVINLAGYSESIQNLIVAITLDTFYAQMQAAGHSEIEGEYRQLTKMILVDEADNFLSKNFNSIKKILKEGREFGVGVVLSTQFLTHFSSSTNDYSQYILTWVIHKVNQISNKEIGNIFSVTDKSEQDVLVNKVKNLEKHYSLVNLGGSNEPLFIRDRAFWELMGK
ncbi:hypothetical protein SANA_07830 [Gottschalkiaceae bacterium SANA]|nr:hypothetical protein SANA_07830 [Gottschalkiaceae bacterium SANA]